MTADTPEWAAVRFWAPPTWSLGFFARCALLQLGIVVVPTSVLISVGQGIPALIVLVALSLWPWPRRLCASREGVRVRYLFIEQTIPIADIEGASIERDPRRGVLGRRETVLRIQRRSGAALLVFASRETLRRLSETFARQLAPVAGAVSDTSGVRSG